MILGIDEVGRGPWAGPLVVGAVVLGGAKIDGLTDSKKLTKKRREQLYDEIYDKAAGVGIGWVEATEIDEIGLSEALKLATKRAVKAVNASFHEVIIDGTVNFLTGTPLEKYVSTMKKADLLVPSVSAASIVAKVARDRFMAEQDTVYPGYGFRSHVGYGTAAHAAAIQKLGLTPLHRLSFAPMQKYSDTFNAGPVASSAPKNFSSSLKKFLGAAPRSATSKLSSEVSGSRHPDEHITTREIGNTSEDVAAQELKRRGHTILARNWKTKYCEIDIISQQGGALYFTEVKHRKNAKAGDGIEAITAKKLRQMKFATKLFVANNKLENVDLMLVAISTSGDEPQMQSYIEIRD